MSEYVAQAERSHGIPPPAAWTPRDVAATIEAVRADLLELDRRRGLTQGWTHVGQFDRWLDVLAGADIGPDGLSTLSTLATFLPHHAMDGLTSIFSQARRSWLGEVGS